MTHEGSIRAVSV